MQVSPFGPTIHHRLLWCSQPDSRALQQLSTGRTRALKLRAHRTGAFFEALDCIEFPKTPAACREMGALDTISAPAQNHAVIMRDIY